MGSILKHLQFNSASILFIGDFNSVRFQLEWVNYRVKRRDMEEFNNWINSSNLLEVLGLDPMEKEAN